MASGNVIMYNIATFVSGIFLLEFGADKFLEHTAIVARCTGIPDTIIALFTAGAEWEEVGFKRFNIAFVSLLIVTPVSSLSSYPLLPKDARH